MTMPLLAKPIGLRAGDLADAGDRAAITAFVQAHPEATPFHLPAWNIAVSRGCRQRAHVLVAEQGSEIVGVVPLTEISSPLFGRALVSTGFGVGGGILARQQAAVPVLAEAAWALAERLHCPTLELRGGPLPVGDWHIDDTTYLGFVRDLAGDDEAELAGIPRKQRAEVRRSLSNDLSIAIGRHSCDVAAHYAIYAESVRNLGTPVFPARLFREVLAEFGDAADVLVVRQGTKAVASVLSVYMNDTVYPYWGGGTAAARGLRANDRMYFELMRHARARGCKRFDFGRSKAGTGPAAFKKNWGFDGVALRYAKRAAAGQQPREINPMSPKYRLQVAAWRKLPLWAANRLGPMIARGLG